MTEHPLAEVRDLQHHAETDWLSVAQEGICAVLRRRPTIHADDLEELGIPDEHRNVIGSAFASLVAKKFIVSTEQRRASKVRRRNCRKSFIYQAGPKFPATTGVRDGNTVTLPSCAIADSGGVGVGADGWGSGQPVSDVAAETQPARLFEPLSLLPEPDPEAWAA